MAVIDASVVLAALIATEHGRWAGERLTSRNLVAPHLLPAEVTSALRRMVRTGAVSRAMATSAIQELGRLPVELYPFEPFADRVWELRDNLTAYDAWYVALAEAHDAPLATLDRRLVEAPGPRCAFVTPRAATG